MQAKVGDRLRVESNKAESAHRDAEILEVHGSDGAPPYLVRWPDGQEGLVFPGPDSHVLPGEPPG